MKTDNNDSVYPPGWDERYSKSMMRYKELVKPLHEAKVAIQLCSMMEDALRLMDAHQASGLEEIGRLLHNCGLFDVDADDGSKVSLPFSVYASIYLEEEDEYVSDMMSDYILATNEGAKTEDDYRRYDYILRHKPTVKALALERKKLYELIGSIERQLQEDVDKKMAEHYASNKNWRKQKQSKK